MEKATLVCYVHQDTVIGMNVYLYIDFYLY